MVLVKLKSADQKIDVIASKHRVDEKQLKSLGEVSDLEPGMDRQLKAKLAPGYYLLLCNIKGHYEAGMHARSNRILLDAITRKKANHVHGYDPIALVFPSAASLALAHSGARLLQSSIP